MASWAEIGTFYKEEPEVADIIHAVICNGCNGEEEFGCLGCIKEIAIINLMIDYCKNIKTDIVRGGMTNEV